MQYTYTPKGICAREMQFTVENGKVSGFTVQGGCVGNLRGISRLVEGMAIEEVIARLEGICCEGRPSSCPAQLAEALKQL